MKDLLHPIEILGKYGQLRKVKLKKARKEHICSKCGNSIPKNSDYYKEDIGKIMKPPSMVLRSFCTSCYSSFGDTVLHQ